MPDIVTSKECENGKSKRNCASLTKRLKIGTLMHLTLKVSGAWRIMDSQRTCNLEYYKNLKFDDVFTFDNMLASYTSCCKGVNWKPSTTRYKLKAISNVSQTLKKLKDGTYKSKPFSRFVRTERGKARSIQALHISDRVVQKCYCDYFLVPLLSKTLIYNNGACLKGKGLKFTTDQLTAHLQKYYRRNKGNVGYVLTFDFSKFFESINHQTLLSKVRKLILDDKLYNMFAYFVNSFDGDKGLGLGSQISQVCALFFVSDIDHYVKEKLKIRFYGRYMDDGYLISNNKSELIRARDCIIKMAADLGLTINVKKTKLWKLEKGFMFLNRHWTLTNKNFVKRKPSHTTLLRLRKRYRKIVEKNDPEALERFKGSVNGFIHTFKNRRLEEYVYS